MIARLQRGTNIAQAQSIMSGVGQNIGRKFRRPALVSKFVHLLTVCERCAQAALSLVVRSYRRALDFLCERSESFPRARDCAHS